jgi:catechol 2,3-dioxygenase-like lactoylglutathione lyase family enzyme
MTSGFHHIALVCRDMNETIKFYELALGMKCRAVYPMHGVAGAKHCFLEAGSHGEISFVQFAQPMEGVPGVSYPAKNSAPSPITTLHHMAYRTETLKQLYAIRDQVKKAGARPSKVIDHHFIHSFYFSDPNGFHLEVTCTQRPYSAEEFKLDVLARPLDPKENDWDEPAAKARAATAAAQL